MGAPLLSGRDSRTLLPYHGTGITMAAGKTATPLDGLELVPEVILSTDAASIQAQRLRGGRDLADILAGGTVSILETGDGLAVVDTDTGETVEDRSAAFAALLSWAAEDRNHAAGVLDGNEGETFYGSTSLWRPSLRLDPNWMEAMRRRSRGRASEAMRRMLDGLTTTEQAARRYKWHQRLTLKLVTLTMPHHAGTSSLEEVRRLNRALELLKKRTTWRDAVAGGVKGVEDALDADGPHVHAHLLILAKRIERADLVEAWRECLDEATQAAYGFGLAEDCQVVVDIRAVRKKGRTTDESITLDDALAEVTKYVTKPADFMKPDKDGRRIPREVLLDLCEVRRWPRMFELLGRCRTPSKASQAAQYVPGAAQAALVSIRRAYLTGEPIKIPAGVGWELVEGWTVELDGPLELRQRIILALKGLDQEERKRIRPPSWRDLLDVLPLPEWLRIMADRVRRGRVFRLNQLLDANPSAYLVTFDGRTFGSEPVPSVV